ncbi:MAG TPA: gluconate 2-dehydrogenase subunit 3 family protein, partial [Burkholderiales bacterium]|nr:gluconate 2-dehydrogenase subunit 3 family protein [Burkholderiales bacterium]
MTNNENGRRKALKHVAAIGAAVTLPASVMQPATAIAADAAPARGALQALTTAEAATLEAIVARLIPSDESGPGAKEARAADYIDRSLAGALAGSRKTYEAGLAAVDAYASRPMHLPANDRCNPRHALLSRLDRFHHS